MQAAVLHVPADLGTIQDQDYDDDVEGEHGRRSCEDLPPGNAWGLVKRCRPAGSSSGIAKGDFNGDTFADLAIGMPEENTPSTQADSGAVIVIYGSANGLTATDPNVPPSQFWSQNTPGIPDASEAGDGFGSALAAGDFNSDGFSDLAIGVPFEDLEATGLRNSGAVIVIFGSAKGLSATDAPVAPQHFDLADDFGGDAQLFVDEFFGFSLAWGDFDGDETGDLAIGIPGMSTIGPGIGAGLIGASGAVAVLFGSDRGLSSAGSQFLQQGVDGIADEQEARDEFGRALTSGDFNGDTVSDLAVGVPGEDLGTTIQNEGAVAIILGDAGSGLTSVNNRLQSQVTGLAGIPRPANNDGFGSVLTTGDFNGDTISDLVIGVPLKDVNGTDAGGVYIFMGSDIPAGLGGGVQFWNQNRVFPNANPLERKISEAGDQFGGAVAAGDFDGDGRSDLAVGVPFEVVTSFRFGSSPTNIDRAGEVDVIYGSADGLSISGRAPQVQHQDQVNIEEDAEILDRFGSSLTAWNFGNGPQADLAIGVPFEDVSGQQDAGAVNVLYGSSTGLTFSRDQLWHQNSTGVPGAPEAGDHFGKALY